MEREIVLSSYDVKDQGNNTSEFYNQIQQTHNIGQQFPVCSGS